MTHRAALAATITALCSPALFACTSDAASPDPTTTNTPPTTTATSPTTTPPTTTPTTPTDPSSPPPLAKRKSIPGAKAFVRFYVGAINTSINPKSTAILRTYSTGQCVTCRGIAASMEKIRRNHGFYRGGDWVIASMVPIPHQGLQHPILHTAVTVTPGAWKRSPADHLRKIKADKMYVDVHLQWDKTAWIVTSIVSA